MSILSKIEGGVKTLAHDVEAALTEFKKDEPKIESIAAATLSTVGPLVIAVTAAAAGGPAAAATAVILTNVQNRLAAAQVVISSLSSATSAKTLLTLVVADLQSLLSVAGIKNGATGVTITEDVDKIVAALQIVIAAI